MIVEPLKVLHVVGGIDDLGGVMSFVKRIAGEDAEGVQNYIWKHRDFQANGDACRYVCRGRATYTDLGLGRDILCAFQELVPLVKWAGKEHNLILHAHSRMGLFASLMAAFWLRVPLAVHLHRLASRPEVYRKVWEVYRAKPIFNSHKTCRHYGCEPARSLIVMPPLLWPERVAERTVGVVRFIGCGAFVRGKHFDILVRAFKYLRQQGVAAELHIFGLTQPAPDPVCQNEIIALAQTDSAIYLHEWDLCWAEQLTASDVFVHLGHPESFGIVILEAFARGCKVVVLRDTFLDEFVPPLNTTEVYAVEELSLATVACQMKNAATAGPAQADLWVLRRNARFLFSIEASRAELAKLYAKMFKTEGTQ